MSRMNTLSATLTVVIVLSIGFFVYQAIQTPVPKTKVLHTTRGEKSDKNSTKVILADWTQERPAPKGKKIESEMSEKSLGPVLVSTTASTPTKLSAKVVNESQSAQNHPVLNDVHFHFDRSGLSQETRSMLDQHVVMLQDPQWSVLVEGHTDQEGTIQQNLNVGLYRANSVKKYLEDHGIEPDRIEVVSLGEFQPICSEPTPECQYQNRRVSFLLARRNHPKELTPKGTVSKPSGTPYVLQESDASVETTEEASPVPIQETKSEGARELTRSNEQALASFNQREPAPLNPSNEARRQPLPVEQIIPEPVHSTPPPVEDLKTQSQQQ